MRAYMLSALISKKSEDYFAKAVVTADKKEEAVELLKRNTR